jgi:hypothetical protein
MIFSSQNCQYYNMAGTFLELFKILSKSLKIEPLNIIKRLYYYIKLKYRDIFFRFLFYTDPKLLCYNPFYFFSFQDQINTRSF